MMSSRFEKVMMPTYGVPPVAIVRGEGSRVWDEDGREYLDLIGGIAVSSLGHAHPALVKAVSDQVATIAHTSNLFMHPREVELAERLIELLGFPGRVFLANSGTEANECALKLVVKHGRQSGRGYIVAAQDGFHGRSLGALSLTGKAAIREPFGPFPLDVRFVPYGDADALKAAVTRDCMGVFLEPVQGEAGVVPPPDGYLKAARQICDETGALLVLDEIQAAIGRTGTWFSHTREGIVPDVLTLAKGLGGGLPIGACIGIGEYGSVLEKGDHGSTFGGNPVACAAALAVLDQVGGLLDHVTAVGEELASGITAAGIPVRGRGLWLAMEVADAPAVQRAAQAGGFLVNALRADAVRLAPPLIITAEEVASFTGRVHDFL